MDQKALRRFRIIGITTITAVYLLILIGAIVRSSGAGMGCPDWPTCFGQWIPPTQESQLPNNYHELYAKLGYANTDFNPIKTWTEYLNRLAGVTIGILMILTTILAFPFLKSADKGVFYVSLTALLLVVFQGWLGAVVVSSNLHPVMITAHMLLALTIVALLIYAVARSQRNLFEKLNSHALNRTVYMGLWMILGLTLIQIILGAQVREAVDTIAKTHEYQNRYLWREELPWVFYVHRAFAFILLTANFWTIWQFLKTLPENHLLFHLSIVLGILIVLAVGAGISLERLGIPPFIQPIHLLLANLIFGVQFFMLVTFRYCRVTNSGSDTTQHGEISVH